MVPPILTFSISSKPNFTKAFIQTMNNHHFLVICFPFHGHINPTIRLATKLTRSGARVTFATTIHGLNNLKTRPLVPSLSYDSFSDGYDEEHGFEKPNYFEQMKLVGSLKLKNLLLTKEQSGQKVDFIIYGMCFPWVAEVARELQVPSAFFYFQSVASFCVVYHFSKNDGGVVNHNIDPRDRVEIPGLPLLNYSEIPTFLLPTSRLALAPIFQEDMQTLDKQQNPCILINTFDGLEEESIKSLPNHIKILSVGPLVPGHEAKDLDQEIYIQWLDSKPKKSVIYVSFGSVAKLGKYQKEEIFRGLIESCHPFLWTIGNQLEDDELVKRYMAMEHGGMIVKWCSQAEVLNHASIGCFVTHGGWNSTIESVAGGVPMVGCPQSAEQKLNIKMVDEVWGNGVKAVAGHDGVVGREEIKRCLKVVMGGVEIKLKSQMLKRMAMEALVEGSHTNLKQLFKRLQV